MIRLVCAALIAVPAGPALALECTEMNDPNPNTYVFSGEEASGTFNAGTSNEWSKTFSCPRNFNKSQGLWSCWGESSGNFGTAYHSLTFDETRGLVILGIVNPNIPTSSTSIDEVDCK